MPKKSDAPLSQEDKLDEILLHLRRIDNRDRLRMIGSTLRGLVALASLLLLFASVWYVAQNGDQLLKMITEQTTQSIQNSMKFPK
jgi:hypothetical protein